MLILLVSHNLLQEDNSVLTASGDQTVSCSFEKVGISLDSATLIVKLLLWNLEFATC